MTLQSNCINLPVLLNSVPSILNTSHVFVAGVGGGGIVPCIGHYELVGILSHQLNGYPKCS